MIADFTRQIKTIRRFFFSFTSLFLRENKPRDFYQILRLENKVCRGCSLIGFPLK